jgi:plastocyanin
MLKSGTTGKRLGLAIALIALGAMVCAGIALAASDVIVAGPSEAFDHQPGNAPYNTDQGVVVQFQDAGGTHNVTARQTGPDGKALFRSATISGGTAGVDGSQYLTTGDYQFFCSVHPTTMSGTLHVTGAGTALARPQISLVVISRKLATVAKKGKLQVNVGALTTSDDISVEAKLGKTSLGKADVSHLANGQKQTVTVKLNKAAKNKLKGKKKATITVVGTVAFGSPATAKGKLK